MTEPTAVATACRECGWSPVELLKAVRDRRYLWCQRCLAIWLDSWIGPDVSSPTAATATLKSGKWQTVVAVLRQRWQ